MESDLDKAEEKGTVYSNSMKMNIYARKLATVRRFLGICIIRFAFLLKKWNFLSPVGYIVGN